MNDRDAQRHANVLWRIIATTYREIVYLTAAYGVAPEPIWGEFLAGVIDGLTWADVSAASSLRWRALRIPTWAPAPDVGRIAEANAWVAAHLRQTDRARRQRARWLVRNEQQYLARKAWDIAALLRNHKLREGFEPAYRIARQYRDAVSEIANTAEQVQLADPFVGAAFPYVIYKTREDSRVRPTHVAMQGFVAARNWEGWPLCRPPCAWSCRCFLRFVARFEARKLGWLDAGDHPTFELRWPNSKAKENWEMQRFPEWREPRYWAPDLTAPGAAA